MAPTPGLVPLAGVVPFASDLDRVGRSPAPSPTPPSALGAMSGSTTHAAACPDGSPWSRSSPAPEPARGPGRLRGLGRRAAGARRRGGAGVGAGRTRRPGGVHDPDLGGLRRLARARVATGLAGEEVVRRYELGLAVRDRDPRPWATRRPCATGCAPRCTPRCATSTCCSPPRCRPRRRSSPARSPRGAGRPDVRAVHRLLDRRGQPRGLPALSVPAPSRACPSGRC